MTSHLHIRVPSAPTTKLRECDTFQLMGWDTSPDDYISDKRQHIRHSNHTWTTLPNFHCRWVALETIEFYDVEGSSASVRPKPTAPNAWWVVNMMVLQESSEYSNIHAEDVRQHDIATAPSPYRTRKDRVLNMIITVIATKVYIVITQWSPRELINFRQNGDGCTTFHLIWVVLIKMSLGM